MLGGPLPCVIKMITAAASLEVPELRSKTSRQYASRRGSSMEIKLCVYYHN